MKFIEITTETNGKVLINPNNIAFIHKSIDREIERTLIGLNYTHTHSRTNETFNKNIIATENYEMVKSLLRDLGLV